MVLSWLTLIELACGSASEIGGSDGGAQVVDPQQPAGDPDRPPRRTAIGDENERAGDTGWMMSKGGNGLSAFAGATSVAPGETVAIYVAADEATSGEWELWRVGYYGGKGGRRVDSGGPIAIQHAASARLDPATGAVSAPWNKTFDLHVADDAVTGVYLLKIETKALQTYALLVVREPRSATPRASVLYPLSVNTYQAYNKWGGTSLYNNSRDDWAPSHAYAVSFDRPYAMGDGTALLFTYDIDFIRFVEGQGYDLAYATDVDLDADPALSEGRRLIAIQGHTEYWTKGMRAAVEKALAAGTNLAFLGANDSYWQVRYASGGRLMIGYKDAADRDPIRASDPSLVTTQWRLAPVSRPENALLGIMYMDDWIWTSAPLRVSDPSSWVWEGAGVKEGTLIPGLFGIEVDKDAANGVTPPGLQELGAGTVESHEGVLSRGQSTVYTAPSGARVFAAGSLTWSRALGRPGFTDPRVQIATGNLFGALAGDGQTGPQGLRQLMLGTPAPAPRYRGGVTVETLATGLRQPTAVAGAPDGSAVVATPDEIQRVTADGKVTTIAGGFSGPRGLAVAPDGTIYVADTGHDAVRAIDPGGGVRTLASLNQPMGLARRSDGTLLVADPWGSKIRAVSPGGGLSIWAGDGSRGVKGGPGLSASFYFPFGVAVLSSGTAVVVEADSGLLRRIEDDGDHTVGTFAGSLDRIGWGDGERAQAQVHETIAVVGGPDGTLIFADAATARIRIIDGDDVETLAGGATGARADGPGDKAGFGFPRGLGMAADGSILVADSDHGAVRRIRLH